MIIINIYYDNILHQVSWRHPIEFIIQRRSLSLAARKSSIFHWRYIILRLSQIPSRHQVASIAPQVITRGGPVHPLLRTPEWLLVVYCITARHTDTGRVHCAGTRKINSHLVIDWFHNFVFLQNHNILVAKS